MIKKILFCFDEHDFNKSKEEISYLSKVSGLTLIKRILLTFQFSGGKEVIVVLPQTLVPLVEQQLKDKRFTLNIQLFDPAKLSEIKSALNDDFLFISEKSVFQRDLMIDLLQKKIAENRYTVSVQLKFPKLQGNVNVIQTGFNIISQEVIKKYPYSDFSKSSFLTFLSEIPFRNEDFGKQFYLKINSKKSVHLGEKGLFQFLTKPTDPLISRNLNRPVSLFITRFLMHTTITPNMMTFVTLCISILSCYIVYQQEYIYGVLGGILFHMASVIDGCDGELARLKFQFSKIGEWFDGFVDDFKNVLFGIAIGIRSYEQFRLDEPNLAQFYLIGVWVYGMTYFLSKVLQNYKLLSQAGSKDILDYKYYFEEKQAETKLSLFSKAVFFLRDLARSDFIAFSSMIVGFLSFYYIGFWILCAFSVGMFFLIISQTIINFKKA